MLTTLPPHCEMVMAKKWDMTVSIFQAGLGKLVYSGSSLCPTASKPLQDVLDKVFQDAEFRPKSEELLVMLHNICPKT